MQATNLDLEKDVLPLLGGDYALSVSTYGKDGSVQPGVVFQMKLNSKDVPKAQEVVQKLADAMSNGTAEKLSGLADPFYMMGPSSEDADLGMPVSGAAVGVAKDRLIFVFDMDSLAIPSRINSLLSGFGKGLGTAAKWQEVPRNLPKDSNALMYVDVTGIRTLAESQMPPERSPATRKRPLPSSARSSTWRWGLPRSLQAPTRWPLDIACSLSASVSNNRPSS